MPEQNTIGEVFEQYPAVKAWQIIFAAMFCKMKLFWNKPRFRKFEISKMQTRRTT
jgi:hypothetical protein